MLDHFFKFNFSIIFSRSFVHAPTPKKINLMDKNFRKTKSVVDFTIIIKNMKFSDFCSVTFYGFVITDTFLFPINYCHSFATQHFLFMNPENIPTHSSSTKFEAKQQLKAVARHKIKIIEYFILLFSRVNSY